MREWLSGGAPPCQGGGRGFDPRLALSENKKDDIRWISSFFVFLRHSRASKFDLLFIFFQKQGILNPKGKMYYI